MKYICFVCIVKHQYDDIRINDYSNSKSWWSTIAQHLDTGRRGKSILDQGDQDTLY